MHVPLFSSSLSVPISSYSRSLLPSSSPPSSPPPSSPPSSPPPSSPPPSSPPPSSPLPLSPSLLLPLPTVVPQECNKLCETSQGRKRQFARKEETEERGPVISHMYVDGMEHPIAYACELCPQLKGTIHKLTELSH